MSPEQLVKIRKLTGSRGPKKRDNKKQEAEDVPDTKLGEGEKDKSQAPADNGDGKDPKQKDSSNAP